MLDQNLLGTYDNKNKFREDFIQMKNEFLKKSI